MSKGGCVLMLLHWKYSQETVCVSDVARRVFVTWWAIQWLYEELIDRHGCNKRAAGEELQLSGCLPSLLREKCKPRCLFAVNLKTEALDSNSASSAGAPLIPRKHFGCFYWRLGDKLPVSQPVAGCASQQAVGIPKATGSGVTEKHSMKL